ncbi:MAG: copper chaperone PCu(A)C [Rhodospirillales bacterium]|nr:copper chaperone PCu(A)C [Rhodospirillales bacterium]
MEGHALERNSNGASGVVSRFRRKPEEAPASVPSAVHGALEIHKPWARSSSHRLPNTIAGAFLAVANMGPDDDRLVAASSPLAERIELHGIKVVGADIDMRPLASGVAIPAGRITILKPRGYHLLLQGVKAPLAKGSTLPVTLTFERAGAVAVAFAVEEPGLIGEAILNEEHHRA